MRTSEAAPVAANILGETGAQYLTFMLAGEEYGVDIMRVQEIKGWDQVTRLPYSPEFILGVIDLRGVIVPIIDLRRRFGIDTVAFGPTAVVIVVRVTGASRGRTIGVVVDAVSEVYNVDPGATKPPPAMCGDAGTIFVKALATVEDKMLILLDIDRIVGGLEDNEAERS